MDTRLTLRNGLILALGAFSTIGAVPAVFGSNHSDAPLIKQDPQANLTDVYAFIGTQYDNPSIKVLNVSMSFRPFSEPGDGAQYERFADDARYSIHITDPKTGVTRLRYDFSFSPVDAKLQEPEHDSVVRARHGGRPDHRRSGMRVRTSPRSSRW